MLANKIVRITGLGEKDAFNQTIKPTVVGQVGVVDAFGLRPSQDGGEFLSGGITLLSDKLFCYFRAVLVEEVPDTTVTVPDNIVLGYN